MHKRTFIYTDASQRDENALWSNVNDAKLDSEFHIKHNKKIHLISIKPMDGGAPINVVREENKK